MLLVKTWPLMQEKAKRYERKRKMNTEAQWIIAA